MNFSVRLCVTVLYVLCCTVTFALTSPPPLKGNLTAPARARPHEPEEDPAVTLFREYLRINTAHPNPDYEGAIRWFRDHADYFGLDFHHIRLPPPGLFAIWYTWKGRDPSLKSVLFNTHMDLVAVDRQFWVVDPFEGYKDPVTGNIIARGAQDMKSATIAQLEAARRLKADGYRPLRTIHFSITPDEEFGSWYGMKIFVNTPEFRALNVGVDMDEGAGNGSLSMAPNGVVSWGLGIGAKIVWEFNVTATGLASHGSVRGGNGTAGVKLKYVMDRMDELKYAELALLDPNAPFDPVATAVTTINLVELGGGYGPNIVPHVLWAQYDMRVRFRPGGWTHDDYERFLNETCADAGPGVSYTFFRKPDPGPGPTTVADETNPWWRALESVCAHMNWVCVPGFKASTGDARYVRRIGIPAFSYNVVLPVYGVGLPGAHGDNEAINELDWLAAIDRQKEVIRIMSSFPEYSGEAAAASHGRPVYDSGSEHNEGHGHGHSQRTEGIMCA